MKIHSKLSVAKTPASPDIIKPAALHVFSVLLKLLLNSHADNSR